MHRIKEKGAQSCEGGSTGTEICTTKVCKISVLETIFLASLTHYGGILLVDKP